MNVTVFIPYAMWLWIESDLNLFDELRRDMQRATDRNPKWHYHQEGISLTGIDVVVFENLPSDASLTRGAMQSVIDRWTTRWEDAIDRIEGL